MLCGGCATNNPIIPSLLLPPSFTTIPINPTISTVDVHVVHVHHAVVVVHHHHAIGYCVPFVIIVDVVILTNMIHFVGVGINGRSLIKT
jgi:hypothetical protein